MTTISAKGHNGTVTFDGVTVTIERTGALARLSVGKSTKSIPLTSITAVQWKAPGPLVNGFIQFTVGGGMERRSSFGRQTVDAVNDENSVIVVRKQRAEFEALRDAIQTAIAARTSGQAALPASGAEEVARLAQLHDQGVITDEEFAAAKARALGL